MEAVVRQTRVQHRPAPRGNERRLVTQHPRRRVLSLAAGAVALPTVSSISWAQAYPSRLVRLVVGYPAAGANDIFARLIAEWLSKQFGRSFIVENRPGAASNIATEAVVRAPADGYTLLVCGTFNAINETLYDKLNFDFIRDLAPVAGIIGSAYVMVVHPSFPAKTVPEFIAYAKANPGRINMASVGTGSTPHVVGELFKSMAGVNLVHVPYRTSPFPDLLGGQVHVYFPAVAASIEFIRAGTLRALAVTATSRVDALPDIPTMADFIPAFEASGWIGVGAPQNASRDHRQAQQGDQCGPRRSQDQRANCRFGEHSTCPFACRLREAHHR